MRVQHIRLTLPLFNYCNFNSIQFTKMNCFNKIRFYLFVALIFIQACSSCVDPNGRSCRHKRLEPDSNSEPTISLEPNDDMSPVEVSCSRDFKKKSNELHRESVCRHPKKVLVPLKMPTKYYMPGVVHRPTSYLVERCDGHCQRPNHKCLPIEKQTVEVPVTSDFVYERLITANKRSVRMVLQEKCMMVKVERHTLCRCECAMSEQSCNDNQIFSQDRCACECKDNSSAKTCGSINKMWDPVACKCSCPPTASRTCSSGAVFDEETCRCMQTHEFRI